ncbi:uncharacterized protein LOC127877015 [Dreissena polymorpha]|uniref:uncharacterized protein LOC127877015 n=1 Tax=Dreissena polymorpha TaxID=45954 RepID=UPI002264EC35|nr:uncharacterized protein LOC127877015 [Dreissena polymorpha]
MNVETKGGDRAIVCKKVLLATGALTELNALLPGILIDQMLRPLTVSLVEVSKEHAEQQLKCMPCVIYRGDGHHSWHKVNPNYKNRNVGFYMLPPIKYPDGVTMSRWHGDSCFEEETPKIRPYIDMVHGQLGVAIGGNDDAAKSSDEIGRMAAMMMLREWDSPISGTFFGVSCIKPDFHPDLTFVSVQ